MTDDSHSSARILDVRPIRVREELDRGRIVVFAGFQDVKTRMTSDSESLDTLLRTLEKSKDANSVTP
ncbi:hypothetical protein XI08_14790 [Bradyrhizobium sp. CCBAU 11361]|nr:hypothetical protein [Bradyrhizobium sp. CCBAU 11361]